MSTKRLIELATGNSQMNRGTAMAMRRRLDSRTADAPRITQAQRIFLDRLLEQPKEEATSRGAYDHPAASHARSKDVDKKKTDLLPSDLLWLQRLPTEPEKISLGHARTLYGLLTSLKLGKASQSDRRLVQSYWEPVKNLHDKAEAEHNLQLASRPLPSVTSEAVHAVAESLCCEDPTLDPEFASIQARRLLDQAAGAKAAEQGSKVRLAQQRLDEIKGGEGPAAA